MKILLTYVLDGKKVAYSKIYIESEIILNS